MSNPPDPVRVLVVTAHPDDVDFGVSGSIAAWTDRNITVTYCIVTDGAAGSATSGVEAAVLTQIRQEEQRKAAAEVGVTDVHFLGYPDGSLQVSLELRRDIARMIRLVRPSAWSASRRSATGNASVRVTRTTSPRAKPRFKLCTRMRGTLTPTPSFSRPGSSLTS